MIYDDLTGFLNWWFSNGRPLNIPLDDPIYAYKDELGKTVTLFNVYRSDVYQVQLIHVPPNTEIKLHIHPNMDSYEVFNSGDVVFENNGQFYSSEMEGSMMPIRILPTSWHGGVFGKAGATFYSVQKYINGTLPSSAGEEWYGADGSTQYKV